MPTYAILGATGATGSQLLTHLISTPNANINLFIRSKSKLLSLFPDLSCNKKVHIFEGSINDTTLIASCIANTTAVFSVVATNENIPGLHIAQDAAQAVVRAAKTIKAQNPDAKLPQIVLLSSATLSPTERTNPVVHWVIAHAFYHMYADLRLAEAFYDKQMDWLNVTYVQPGGLVEAPQKGHRVGGGSSPMLGYSDLAAGMIEIVTGGGYEGKRVAVAATTNVRPPLWLPLTVAEGLLWTFVPMLHRVAKSIGLR